MAMNTFIGVWIQQALVITLLLILTGCYVEQSPTAMDSPPFSCTKFTESHWQEFGFGTDSPTDVISSVVNLWDIDSDRVRVVELSSEDLRVKWGDIQGELGIDYSALFREERQLIKVDVRWHPNPTLAQVIDCLGFPEYYAAFYQQEIETASLNLAFWYVEKGFVVRHVSFHRQERPPEIRLTQRMTDLFVVAPGTSEQMVPNVYTYGDEPAVQAWGLCVIRPWSGSIETIEVESFLENPRCKP